MDNKQTSPAPQPTCFKHKKNITHICIHPDCFKFQALCEDCHKEHLKKHTQNHLHGEQEWILTKSDCQTRTQNILIALREELELTENRAANALISAVTSNIDEILMEIESIRQQINKLFDRYIQGLKEKFEYKIKSNIHSTYDQIQMYLAQVKELTNNIHVIGVQKKINQTDLGYQVLYQKSRLENLLYQRANQKFQGRIDDDVALHFIGVIQKELDSLVIYDGPQQLNGQQKKFEKFKSYTALGLEQHRVVDSTPEFTFFTNWMFYFEPDSKNFHYMDLRKKAAKIETIKLDIPFNITNGSRSILGSDGRIYYMHGYDDNQHDELNKTIYLYDNDISSLVPKARMHTLRRNYSLCASRDKEIFIIGGQNYMEGCLNKCEKYNINTNSITIIKYKILQYNSHLQELSALHTTCLYNNTQIVKYGGLRALIENENLRDSCKDAIEVYNIEQDIWTSVQFSRDTLSPTMTILSSCFQVPNKSQIYIFGGSILLKNSIQSTNQGFRLLIEEENELDNTDQLRSQLIFAYQLNHPTPIMGTYACQPVQYQNNIHILQFEKGIAKHLEFGSKWKVL